MAGGLCWLEKAGRRIVAERPGRHIVAVEAMYNALRGV